MKTLTVYATAALVAMAIAAPADALYSNREREESQRTTSDDRDALDRLMQGIRDTGHNGSQSTYDNDRGTHTGNGQGSTGTQAW